jgi:DNA-binding NtrC family response regulator
MVTELGRHLGLVEGASGPRRADGLMARCKFDCVVLDLQTHDGVAAAWLAELRQSGSDVPVVICCEAEDARKAVGLLRFGVAEILLRPFEPASLAAVIQRAREGGDAKAPATVPRGARVGSEVDAVLVGESASMGEVRRLIEHIAPLPATVLVEGETGTGKELAARLLHYQSGRRGAFVPLNCGAIAPELLESELFGHVKGAFTSAHQVREGLFVAARGGTLFLDEISEMPLGLEVKLLRALEEGAIRPVGSDREIKVDVRIVASTQHDLRELVQQGSFREDLYYRLNVIHLALPPLRNRPDDIEPLANFFMETLARELGLAPIPFTPAQVDRMRQFGWPGNVRELRNFVERTLMMGEFSDQGLAEASQDSSRGAFGYPPEWTLEEVKQHHMHRVLEQCGGNRSEAARRLDVSRKTLERKLGPRRAGAGGRPARGSGR